MPRSLPQFPTCEHNGQPGKPFYCRTLSMKNIKDFHTYLYKSQDKIHQDTLILACCLGNKPKRGKKSHDQVAIQYHIRLNNGELVRVCRDAFLGITNFSKNRIQRIVRNYVVCGVIPKERRGGDRVGPKNDEKRLCIKNFIQSLNCVESHYCRSKTSMRLYLPCDLNFKKLYNQYLERVPRNLHVKLSYFRKYVNQYYNIGFGTPQTDVCSTCLRTKEIIKMTTSTEERSRLSTEHRVHMIKAKSFFQLLKNPTPNSISFSFDCQKNLALPRLPDQSAYFSQQINYHNFTVVCGNSKTKLNPTNVFSYLWTEIEAGKDSNVIASAVKHVLNNTNFADSVRKVNLFADGCGGQNKNTIVMSMLAYWLRNEAPRNIQCIELIFPIVGHSFIPPDRVFGLIEKDIKQKPVIVEPTEYEKIIGKYGTVRKLGIHWQIQDWKKATKKVVKPPGSWHFEFNKAKRFIFVKDGKTSNILVRGEPNYRCSVGKAKSICKKTQSISSMSTQQLPLGTKLKGDKSSITKLLVSHYGEKWRTLPELKLYKNSLSNPEEQHVEDEKEHDVSLERCQNQDDYFVI